MKKIILLLMSVFLLYACNEKTEDKNELVDNQIIEEAINEDLGNFEVLSIETSQLGKTSYLLYVPNDIKNELPLIVYLHSAKGKGDDLNILLEMDGLPKYINDGLLKDLNAYVLIPQLPISQKGWVNVGDDVIEIINKTIMENNIDIENISLTGHSVGGTGTWNIAISHPDLFKRLAPLSGSVRVNSTSLNALKNISIKAFVGEKDEIIDPNLSKKMIEELKRVGGDCKLYEFSDATHEDVPRLTYLDENIDLINWLTNGD